MVIVPSRAESTPDFTLVDEGTYRLRYAGYTDPFLSSYSQGKSAPKEVLSLVFEIQDDDEFEGIEIRSRLMSISQHPKSTMYPFLRALLGREPDEDERVNLDDLKGKVVLGEVAQRDKEVNGARMRVADVVGISPLPRSTRRAQDFPDEA